MKDTNCPYCNSVQSLLIGNVYCSHQPRSMDQLDTGTLFIKSKKLEETKSHISRLSIRCMLKGEQYYKVGNHEHLVTPENYLVVNQGQRYKTSFDSNEEQEMILVGFRPGFAEEVYSSIINSDEKLLDDPLISVGEPIYFFEQTYHLDPVIQDLFIRLRSLLNEDIAWRKSVDLDTIYTTMISRLLIVRKDLFSRINNLDNTKHSTRVELYRRLTIAKDYMDANIDRKINVDEVARVAFMSPFHFKRTFKKFFKITPHNYHVRQRLEYSCRLIGRGHFTVRDICHRVGFEDVSSFIRLFRRQYGCTPGEFNS